MNVFAILSNDRDGQTIATDAIETVRDGNDIMAIVKVVRIEFYIDDNTGKPFAETVDGHYYAVIESYNRGNAWYIVTEGSLKRCRKVLAEELAQVEG